MPNRLRKFRDLLEKGKCAICMDFIKPQQALLDCRHNQFCFDCIVNWASISNKCPLCMQKFFTVRNLFTSEILPVEDKANESDEEIAEDIICEICELGNNEESMLLCDCCDKGFHTGCIGITRIPYLEYWFCCHCIKNQPEAVQERQKYEIQQARQIELPAKRSRRICVSQNNRELRLRRSERLKHNN